MKLNTTFTPVHLPSGQFGIVCRDLARVTGLAHTDIAKAYRKAAALLNAPKPMRVVVLGRSGHAQQVYSPDDLDRLALYYEKLVGSARGRVRIPQATKAKLFRGVSQQLKTYDNGPVSLCEVDTLTEVSSSPASTAAGEKTPSLRESLQHLRAQLDELTAATEVGIDDIVARVESRTATAVAQIVREELTRLRAK